MFPFITAVFCLLACCLSQKTPPTLPQEFACNVLQKKWNDNGKNVNHTYSGIWYSSYSKQQIRFDGVFYDTNHTSTVGTSGTQMSLLDFSESASGVNYYIEKNDLSDPGECYTGPVTGFFAPPNATFLSDIGAVFAGNEYSIDYGQCEKWSFSLTQVERAYGIKKKKKDDDDYYTFLTFWFDSNQAFVRWDLVSNGLFTGVQTFHSNCQHDLVFNDDVFKSNCKT